MSDTFPLAFGRYQLVERLAVGGMAELFKARVVGAHGFQKPVVIKKILPHLAADGSFVAMFIDEAKITARLDHPKIAQVLELGTIEDQLYIAMEFVDGLDVLALLRACAQRKQPLPAHIAVHIAHEVLDALEYAHQARDDDGLPLGIVHRDISPSNVLVSRRGDVKLADFGIAHALDRQQKTQAGTLKGKYGYMSPEQVVGGDLDGRSDLFSVGIVLAEMLMGRRLFTAPNELDVLLMVRDVKLERLEKYGAAIDPDLMAILRKAFQKDRNARWPTAAAFRDGLAEWLFSKRLRVTPADLGALVESLYAAAQPAGHTPPPGAPPSARPGSGAASAGGPPAATSAPKAASGTIAGPVTKARQLAAEEQARLAREEAARRQAEAEARAQAVQAQALAEQAARAAAAAAAQAQAQAQAPPQNAPAARGKAGAAAKGAPHRASTAPAKTAAAQRASSEIPIVLDLEEAIISSETIDPMSAAAASPAPALVDGGDSEPIVIIEPRDKSSAGVSRPPDLDFADLAIELGLAPEPERKEPPPAPPSPVDALAMPAPPPPRVGIVADKPDLEGDLTSTPPIRILYKLAVEKSTGLLVVEISAIVKEIYFANGVPEFVSSNVARELFGEYLVAQKVISQGELAMALAMMPHFGGKLGDTLVGLGLLKPLDVFRHLTRQVREKIVDICTWQKGRWRWYRGKRNPREAFPLGLDAFEVLGAGATALTPEIIDAWLKANADKMPVAAKSTRVVPEAFRLGTYPRDVYNRLDGRFTIAQHVARFTNADDRLAFLRTLYLLVHTDLALLS